MFLRDMKEEIVVDLKYLIGHPLFLSLLAFVAGLLLVLFQDMPPRRVVMAMGASDMGWGEDAEHYKKIFEENGVELVLIPTYGSEDDIRRLMDDKNPVQVGFSVTGGIIQNDPKNISTMGRVYVAPFWIFYRKGVKTGKVQKLTDFNGKKINIEQPGTNANSFSKTLFKMNGMVIDNHFSQIDTAVAVNAMEKGEIDVVMFFSPPSSAIIKRLTTNPSVELMNVESADAYSYRADYLDKLIIPEGGLDIARNIPHHQTPVVAAPVELIVKKNLHPSLKMLLMRAASEVHGSELYFYPEGSFPSFGRKFLPEDKEAKFYYKFGTPELAKYLPFWAVEPFYHVLLYVLPAAVFIYIVTKNFTEYRLSRGRRKIRVIYQRLRNLEKEASSCTNITDRNEINSMLSSCENEALQLRLPEELVGDYFTLMNSISSVRNRILFGQNSFHETQYN